MKISIKDFDAEERERERERSASLKLKGGVIVIKVEEGKGVGHRCNDPIKEIVTHYNEENQFFCCEA